MNDPVVLPFKRFDRFGDIGTARQSLGQNVVLTLGALVLLPVRFCSTLVAIVLLWVFLRLCVIFPRASARIIGPGCRLFARATRATCGLLSVTEEAVGDQSGESSADGYALIVTNHSSWMDIPMVSALYGCGYVTKAEVQSIPMVGDITEAVGSIFVNRGAEGPRAEGPSNTELITERLRAKHENPESPLRPLCIFPEGTTTNGRYLLPFRTGAFCAGVPVKPVLVQYGTSSHVNLAYESIPIKRHLFLVFSHLWHSARIVTLPLYTPSASEKADPKLYAANVRQYMADWSRKLGMPLELTNSTFETKKAYHQALKTHYKVNENGKKTR